MSMRHTILLLLPLLGACRTTPVPPETRPDVHVEVIELQFADADMIAGILRYLYRGAAVEGGAMLQIVPDERLNLLLLRGSQGDLDAINGLVERLDVEGAAD